jgi:dTDP-4-amino-4,6-dideoxygalactose transaminase
MAIALALQLMNVGEDDEVLVPAYHCPSMVEPVAWSGATARFYRLRPDLSIDLADLSDRITASTRTVMVTHYFGFLQEMSTLRKLCDERGLMLLEDCAHAFYGGSPKAPVGSCGDYAVSSLMKFFPVFDGGCLVSGKHSLSRLTLKSPGLEFQVRSALNMLERSIQFGRLPVLELLLRGPLWVKEAFWERLKKHAPVGTDASRSTPSASGGGSSFDPSWMEKRMSWFSDFIVTRASHARSIENRRANYLYLRDALEPVPGCHALLPELPPETAPYAFPLLVDFPDPAFWALRRDALPLLRWEDLGREIQPDRYPVSAYYSRHLFQIPCHQELTNNELRWMVNRIRLRLSEGAVPPCFGAAG